MSSKYELDIVNGSFAIYVRVGSLAGVTNLRYTALTSPKKGETALRFLFRLSSQGRWPDEHADLVPELVGSFGRLSEQ